MRPGLGGWDRRRLFHRPEGYVIGRKAMARQNAMLATQCGHSVAKATEQGGPAPGLILGDSRC